MLLALLLILSQNAYVDGGLTVAGPSDLAAVSASSLYLSKDTGYALIGRNGDYYVTADGRFGGGVSTFGFLQVGLGVIRQQLDGPVVLYGHNPVGNDTGAVVFSNAPGFARAGAAQVVTVLGNGEIVAHVDEDGAIYAGGPASFASFLDLSNIRGHITLSTIRNQFPVIGGRMDRVAQRGGPHGYGLTLANYDFVPDGGIELIGMVGGDVLEVDNFDCGPNPCSKKWFVDYQGGMSAYCPDDGTGLRRENFGSCGEVFTNRGDGGVDVTGHRRSTLLYACDQDLWYQCRRDGGWEPR